MKENRTGRPFKLLFPIDDITSFFLQDKMRFYKATDQYVVAVTAREEVRGAWWRWWWTGRQTGRQRD